VCRRCAKASGPFVGEEPLAEAEALFCDIHHSFGGSLCALRSRKLVGLLYITASLFGKKEMVELAGNV
jgi:hypothetical protein